MELPPAEPFQTPWRTERGSPGSCPPPSQTSFSQPPPGDQPTHFFRSWKISSKPKLKASPEGGGETSDERTSCPPLRSAHTPTLGSVPHPSLRDPVWFCSAQVVLREFTEDKPVFPPGRTPDEGGDCSTDLSRDASTAPPSVQEQNRGGGPTPGSSLTSSSWIQGLESLSQRGALCSNCLLLFIHVLYSSISTQYSEEQYGVLSHCSSSMTPWTRVSSG